MPASRTFPRQAIAAALALLLAPASALCFTVGDLNYNFQSGSDTEVYVSGRANSSATDITIPSTVQYNSQTYRVTSIGSNAFRNCSGLTSVTILGNITNDWSYDYAPFRGCNNLATLVLGEKMTKIGNNMFYGCSGLTSVTIPDSVTSIGQEAFSRCSGLARVTIGAGVTSIGDYAFYNCSGLTSVTILGNITNDWSVDYVPFRGCNNLATLVLSEKMTEIGNYMFYGCSSLTSVTIGDSVTSIGNHAFEDCSGLTSVTIPDSVTRIGYRAFDRCYGLTSVHIHDLAAWCGIKFGGDFSNPLEYAHHLYLDGKELVNLTIPDSVTSIGTYMFSGCSGLTSVTIPSNVTSIGDRAFSGCSGLMSVTIGDSVTSIGRYAFEYCSGLTSVTIPDSVTSIGDRAFSGCSGLTSVTIGTGIPYIPYGMFSNCTSLASVTIPDGVTSIGDGAFYGCSGLTSVTIPESVESLSTTAFDGCGRLWTAWYRTLANLSASGGGSSGGGSGGGSGGSGKTVSLTVTNVVVHYVTQSVPSGAVIPSTNSTGIVNIIAEVTAPKAIAITEDWAKQYPGFEAAFGADFSAALTMETGKRDGVGKPMFVWQDYVAGTDPTDPTSVFTASLAFDAETGDPMISWSPELSPAEAAKRKYTVSAKKRITDPDWTPVDGDAADYNFFRVSVEMR